MHFWNNLRYAQNQKIGKSNNIKVVVSKKIKGPKQDSQTGLRHIHPREGEPHF
jgi:hypothetical protein